MMKKGLIFGISLLYAFYGELAAQTYNEKFNLDFQYADGLVKGWMPHAANTGNRVNNETQNGFRPLIVSQSDVQGIRECMNFGISSVRNILLPELKSDMMKIKFEYKNSNIKDGKLYIYLYNKELNQVAYDSIYLQNSDNFREDVMEIPSKDARFLFFDLYALGNDSTYIGGKMGLVATSIPHIVSLKSIKLYDGSTDITESDFKDIPVSPIDKLQCTELTEGKFDFKHMAARITALGEAIHGSAKINALTAEYIRESVLNNNTRLILMEGNLTLWIFFNSYIHGSNVITSEGLEVILNNAFVLDTQEMLRMAKWLRTYNQTARKPVNIIGLDTNFDLTELTRDLRTFLMAVNTQAKAKNIESLASMLGSAKMDNYKELAAFMLETFNKEVLSIDAVVGKEDANIIRYYLGRVAKSESPASDCYYKRDKIMSENAMYFIENFSKENETVLITSHLEHANYSRTNFSPNLSMGYYLKKAYGKDYRCLGELTYEDDLKVLVMGKLQKAKLDKPSANNLESLLQDTNIPKLYVGNDALGELVKIRIQGTSQLPASELNHYYNTKSLLEGFLFTK